MWLKWRNLKSRLAKPLAKHYKIEAGEKMKACILMIQFFTRIPIYTQLTVKIEDFPRSICYLPIVGLLLGLLNVIFFALAYQLFAQNVAITLVLISNVCLTGAFHLDGLADTCDGIFSGRSRERILEIMHDSRIGTNGAVAVGLDFILRFACLSSLDLHQTILALLSAPILSRSLNPILMRAKYAREEGLGNLFIGKIKTINLYQSLFLGGFFILVMNGILCGSILYFASLGFALCYKWYIVRLLGGMTGDTLGAGNELGEILVMLLFSGLARQGLLS